LADPRHAHMALVVAENARYTAEEREGLTVLLPEGGANGSSAALTRGGYLLLARRPEALSTLGAYAARTLPTRPLPEGALVAEVPRSAIERGLAPRLAALWAS